MVRRKGVALAEPALMLRDGLKDIVKRELLIGDYLKSLREAFAVVYRNFDADHSPTPDAFFALERRRRINNIVYYAAVYLEADRDLSGLLGPEFNREDFYRYIRMLHPDGINKVPEMGIVHTIGCAYHLLGEKELAGIAAERLVYLIVDSGADLTADQRLVSVLTDAIAWRGRYRGLAAA